MSNTLVGSGGDSEKQSLVFDYAYGQGETHVSVAGATAAFSFVATLAAIAIASSRATCSRTVACSRAVTCSRTVVRIVVVVAVTTVVAVVTAASSHCKVAAVVETAMLSYRHDDRLMVRRRVDRAYPV